MTSQVKELKETIAMTTVQKKIGEYLQKVYGQEVVYCMLMVPAGGDIPLTKILANTHHDIIPEWLNAASVVSEQYIAKYNAEEKE